MPILAFAAEIWEALALILGPMLRRMLVALGISAVTYVGLDGLIGNFQTYITGLYSNIPSSAFALLDYLGVFVAVKMVMGALTALVAIKQSAKVFRMLSSAATGGAGGGS